ncbi:hypothetical protein niasHT_019319 [Heterodera trifolii]|uniref:Glycine-rich protein n=1 Tax=Heterodera trifolii TaxID=157864 RepID=A0ABD2L5M3_9BILA
MNSATMFTLLLIIGTVLALTIGMPTAGSAESVSPIRQKRGYGMGNGSGMGSGFGGGMGNGFGGGMGNGFGGGSGMGNGFGGGMGGGSGGGYGYGKRR